MDHPTTLNFNTAHASCDFIDPEMVTRSPENVFNAFSMFYWRDGNFISGYFASGYCVKLFSSELSVCVDSKQGDSIWKERLHFAMT